MIIIFVQQAQAANLLLMKYGSCHNDQYAAGGVILTYCSKTFLLVFRVYSLKQNSFFLLFGKKNAYMKTLIFYQ